MGSKLCADFYHQCIERELCLIFSIHTLILAHPEILRCTLPESLGGVWRVLYGLDSLRPLDWCSSQREGQRSERHLPTFLNLEHSTVQTIEQCADTRMTRG